MDNLINNLSKRLLSFFTRSLAPSSVFFLFLFFSDKFFNNSLIFTNMIHYFDQINKLNNIFFYTVLIIVFLSYGYINQIFSQFFDEFFKGNYENHDRDFENLREEVSKRFENKELFKYVEKTDYNFYQVLGKNTNTKNYVDEIKAIYSVVIAGFFNVLFLLLLQIDNSIKIKILFFFIVVCYMCYLGAKKRYIARNKRLYINFIENKSKNKTECKIKYVKDRG